jgi:hypothetical protein
MSILHILFKNNEGKSSLDIAIDNEAPKSVELLLNRLLIMKDYSFSRCIYHLFETLFEMGIKSFEDYLETCFFTTFEMAETNKLRILDHTVEEFLEGHHCSMIDEEFRKKIGARKKKKKKITKKDEKPEGEET